MFVASLVRFPGVFLCTVFSLVLIFDWFGALVGFPWVHVGFWGILVRFPGALVGFSLILVRFPGTLVGFSEILVGFSVRSSNNLVLH